MNVWPRSVVLVVLLLVSTGCSTSSSTINKSDANASAVNTVARTTPTIDGFDAALANSLGADDYGMRSYVMVILMTGPNDAVITDQKKRSELFNGHFANMQRLAKEKKLAVAGPFNGSKTHRGLYIFAVDSIEEAEQLVKTDPTVEAGIFTYEMTQLYASAALMQVGHIHEQIQKTKIN